MIKPLLGITMGDAAGIGPELILKAFGERRLFRICRPLIIGSFSVMDLYRGLFGIDTALRPIGALEEARYDNGVLDVLHLDLINVSALEIGTHTVESGNAAVVFTRTAARMAVSGLIDAVVSAPLNKKSMHLAGYPYEGQTQIFAETAGSKHFGMILLLGRIRVMMLTTHVSLREACVAVTEENVLEMIQLGHDSLKAIGIKRPRIAVAGLNPHAGEGGLFGREECEETIPAIRAAVRKGIHAVGPVPADVVFLKARDGEFDLVLAMFHDQANMAAKLLGFGDVVTLVAGIPFIRTSVGHGTAFDIAGKGIADERNFVLAIETAADMARSQERGSDGLH